MPPSTMSSTSNVILFPGRRFGPSDRKPRRIGAARLLRHDRQLGYTSYRPEELSNVPYATKSLAVRSVTFIRVGDGDPPARSLLRHPGLAQAGEINCFE
jgi:hypothetical protein